MSGLFSLGLIAIWLFAGWIVYMIWRLLGFDTKGKSVWRTIHISIGLVLFIAWFAGGFWPFAGKKMYYDAQVREMCARDGGVSVYEPVILSPDEFDKWGMVVFYHPSKGEEAFGSNYKFVHSEKYFHNEDPKVFQVKYQIYRRNGNMLLGEAIVYHRGGGDLPGFGHPSGFSCPSTQQAGVNALIKSVFVEKE